MKFSTNICIILLLHIFLLLNIFSSSSVNGCPFQVQQFCACVDQLDGVLLNCSPQTLQPAQINANGNNLTVAEHLMQVLKTNQAHLGLIKLLAIHNTSIGQLAENLFSGLYIRRLELVNCQIRKMVKGAFKGLEGVLQELIITGNLIEEMPSEALLQMNSLTMLDLSNNAIGELKAEYALPRLPKLIDINLSHNNITGMHKTFFENVKNNIQTINLGHNLMEEVPASALRGFRMLMAMHLHNNRFIALPQLSFMNLPVLSLLNLASNRIGSIHRQAFLNAPQLRFLYLSGNRINEVHPFQFSSFEHLEMLDLSNNLIESLPNDSFTGLPALRQLYLGENKISQIQPHAFSANSSIAVLILEQNLMTELGKDSFQNLRQIQQISLKNNKLRSIDAGAFQGNPGLVMLDLSHNELIDLAPATFLSQLNLLLVDLSHNRIIRTPFGAFGRRVATVLLQENPLVCIERIHMLQQGNGVFIPNNEDKICGPPQSTIATTLEGKQNNQVGRHNQENGPEHSAPSSPAEHESSSSADFDIEEDHQESAEMPSAFIQQQTALPNAGFSISNEPNGQNPASNRLGNIKPIRITPSTTAQQIGNEKRSRGETPISSSSESTEPIPMSENIAENVGNTDEIIQITTAKLEEIEETTVDPAEARFNPNVIYPHPVPFLKQAPKMHVATHVESDENGNPILTATLPSSILIAAESDQSKPLPTDMAIEGGNAEMNNEIETNGQNFLRNSSSSINYGKFEEFALKNAEVKKAIEPEIVHQRVDEEIGGDEAAIKRGNGKSMLPTAIIVICMGTVAVVMCAVFVGLCVARKRQLRQMSDVGINLTTAGLNGSGPHYGSHYANANSAQHSPNSNSYMTAAAASRAAQMSAFYPKHFHEHQQGTLGIRRSASGTLSNRLPASPDDIYGWLYTPNGYNAFKK